MKLIVKYIVVSLVLVSFMSCNPRIELDLEQWGDQAFLTNVQVFTLNADEHELQEYYTNGELTPALRRVMVSQGNASIDDVAFIATVIVPESVDLTKAGIIMYHSAEKIIPLSDSPKAGILTDLSVGSFRYQVISADGSKHDWTIVLTN